MDFRKLDGRLAGALNEVENPERADLLVFIHTADAADPRQVEFLRTHGVHHANLGGDTFTAALSARSIAELSCQPWVASLTLSNRLRPASTGVFSGEAGVGAAPRAPARGAFW